MGKISRRDFLSEGLAFLIGLATGYASQVIYTSSRQGAPKSAYRKSYELINTERRVSFPPWIEDRLAEELQREKPSEEFFMKSVNQRMDHGAADSLRKFMYRAIEGSDAPPYLSRVPELRESSIGDIALMLAEKHGGDNDKELDYWVINERENSNHIYDGTEKGLKKIRDAKDDIVGVMLLYYGSGGNEEESRGCKFIAISFSDIELLPEELYEAYSDLNVPWVYTSLYLCGGIMNGLLDMNLNGKMDEIFIGFDF